MKVKILSEGGYFEALYGLGLSKGLTTHLSYEEFKNNNDLVARLHKVATKLTPMDGGHNKFLETLSVTIECDMPRYWWSEADTYRLSTKQSESTMHGQELRWAEYEATNTREEIFIEGLKYLQGIAENLFISMKNHNVELAKAAVVESLLQKRVWTMSYKTLKNVISQRRAHKLARTWQAEFVGAVRSEIKYPEFLNI